MTVSRDLALGQLRVANNGNQLLTILDLIALECQQQQNETDCQELNEDNVVMV